MRGREGAIRKSKIENRKSQVFLVGAGPGNPGLITLRAVECLAQADLVLYDKLVPARLLEYAPAAAERVCVADLSPCHTSRYAHIHEAMIAAARAGKCVVRLKGGDPFLFGRGGEEAEALGNAGIAFEVVPGVTSGLAACAYAGIPLTHRLHASAVAFVTGHENPEKSVSALDWEALARFPGTLVIYMGISHVERIAQALLDNGMKPDTPAAVVHWGTTGSQRVVEAMLGTLAGTVREAGLTSPAIIVIGAVASLRPQLAWLERRPLFGKRILVTRPRHQSAGLAQELEQFGAVVHALSVIEIVPLESWSLVDRALDALSSYQWIVFTSSNGVHAFLGRLLETKRDLRALGGLRLAAIGPATADALRAYYLTPDVIPPEFCSESLAASLKDKVAGQRVLLARADRGRDLLRTELSQVARVDQVAVYSQVDGIDLNSESFSLLCRGEVDYITVTSSNIARALARSLNEQCRRRIKEGKIGLVSISPVTSADIREAGLPAAAEASEATAAGVIQALLDLAAKR